MTEKAADRVFEIFQVRKQQEKAQIQLIHACAEPACSSSQGYQIRYTDGKSWEEIRVRTMSEEKTFHGNSLLFR